MEGSWVELAHDRSEVRHPILFAMPLSSGSSAPSYGLKLLKLVSYLFLDAPRGWSSSEELREA